ncbi:MAG: helix-turn-helix transcriptional regulator [Anaerolineae bacterium]|nr:helix-turn-helix transcriptional regulator [Anaerolineae bacterium]
MTIQAEERLSDSPFVESITRGVTLSDGTTIRPAESHWHMVFTKVNGLEVPLVVGPLTTAGIATWGEDAEILWIKFKPGTFIPHMPAKNFLDKETILPEAASHSFWLKGSAWEFPNFENADTFIDRLVRKEILVRDPIVNAVLGGEPQNAADRTVRHRFIQSTGLTHNHIQQIERAQRAAALLRHGKSILDTTFELGYYDQPHLTKSLKQWVGHTPAQIVQQYQESQLATVKDETLIVPG